MHDFMHHQSKETPRFMIRFFIFVCLCSYVLCQAPIILNLSPSAVPGEIITIQGEYFGQNPKVLLRNSISSSIDLEIIQTGYENRFIAARIPSDSPLSLYTVIVRNTETSQESGPKAINVPIIRQFSVPELASGDTLAIFGQNLHVGSKFLSAAITNPPVGRVTLSANGSNDIVLELDSSKQSDAEALYLTVPATVEITKDALYNVIVDNGLGATAYGPTQLLGIVREGNNDLFNLGVNWGKDFSMFQTKTSVSLNPSGSDDSDGIRTALEQVANDGGGIVNLSAGTFTTKSRIDLPNNVVLRGAGRDATIINWSPDSFNLPYYWSYSQCNNCGLADFTLNTLIGRNDPRGEIFFSESNKFFIARCTFYLGNIKQFWTTNSRQIAIIDTEMNHVLDISIGFIHSGNDYLVVSNSRWTYGGHSVNFGGSSNLIIRNSVFQRNSTIQNSDTFHTLALDYSNHIALLNNTLEVIPKGTRAYWNNDGETIISEGGGPYQGDRNSGFVRQLTNNGRTMDIDRERNYDTFTSTPYAAIVSGPGLGQIRKVESSTASTITIDSDWEVQPVVGQSVVSFAPLGAANWLVKDNRLLDNNRGFYLYYASMVNLTFVDNTVNSSYGIIFVPYIHDMRTDADSRDYGLVANWQYQVQIRNNIIYSDVSAPGQSGTDTGGASISVNAQQWATNASFAVLVLGMEIKQNTIQIDRPQMPLFCLDSQFRSNDGIYLSRTNFQNAWPDESVPTILGTIVQDNKFVNLATSFTLGSGAHNSILACSTAVNSNLNISVCTYHPDSYTETKPDQFTLNLLSDKCPAKSVTFETVSNPSTQSNSPSSSPSGTTSGSMQWTPLCFISAVILLSFLVAIQ